MSASKKPAAKKAPTFNDTQKAILISMVRDKEHLWNPTSALYKNNNKKNDTWAEIAREMGIPETEEVKYQWKTLRTQYVREKGGPRSGAGAASKWLHYDSMDFLRDVVACRKSTGNVPVEVDTEDVGAIGEDLALATDELPTENQQESQAAPAQEVSTPKLTPKQKPPKRSMNQLFLDEFAATASKIVNMADTDKDEEDEDHLFAMSIARSLRDLPLHVKVAAKTKLMAVLGEAQLMAVAPPSSTQPGPSAPNLQVLSPLRELHWSQF